MNGRTSREWLVPLTGIAFLVVLIISFIVQGSPKGADHPAAEVASWYKDNKDAVELSAVLGVLAGLLLIFFGAYLRKVLEAADAGSLLPIVVLIGVSIVAIGGAIDGMLLFAAAERANDIPASGIQTIQAIWDNDFLPLILGVEVFLWSAGLAVIRTGALPEWLGWVAVALGVIGFTPIGFVAAMGAAIWIVIVSILLSVRARSAPAAATA